MKVPIRMTRLVGLGLAALLTTGAASSDPAERLHDPAQEARARAIFRDTRCLVCQNESIDDSEAPLADDLRRIVREQVAAGRSDRQVRRFLTDRYGQFVLFKPAFDLGNAALWLTPFLVVGAGGAGLLAARSRLRPAAEPPLDAQEQARLRGLS